MNRHDVINNTLRLEVLGKLIIENLEQNQIPNQEFLSDYVETLKSQIHLIDHKAKATED